MSEENEMTPGGRIVTVADAMKCNLSATVLAELGTIDPTHLIFLDPETRRLYVAPAELNVGIVAMLKSEETFEIGQFAEKVIPVPEPVYELAAGTAIDVPAPKVAVPDGLHMELPVMARIYNVVPDEKEGLKLVREHPMDALTESVEAHEKEPDDLSGNQRRLREEEKGSMTEAVANMLGLPELVAPTALLSGAPVENPVGHLAQILAAGEIPSVGEIDAAARMQFSTEELAKMEEMGLRPVALPVNEKGTYHMQGATTGRIRSVRPPSFAEQEKELKEVLAKSEPGPSRAHIGLSESAREALKNTSDPCKPEDIAKAEAMFPGVVPYEGGAALEKIVEVDLAAVELKLAAQQKEAQDFTASTTPASAETASRLVSKPLDPLSINPTIPYQGFDPGLAAGVGVYPDTPESFGVQPIAKVAEGRPGYFHLQADIKRLTESLACCEQALREERANREQYKAQAVRDARRLMEADNRLKMTAIRDLHRDKAAAEGHRSDALLEIARLEAQVKELQNDANGGGGMDFDIATILSELWTKVYTGSAAAGITDTTLMEETADAAAIAMDHRLRSLYFADITAYSDKQVAEQSQPLSAQERNQIVVLIEGNRWIAHRRGRQPGSAFGKGDTEQEAFENLLEIEQGE